MTTTTNETPTPRDRAIEYRQSTIRRAESALRRDRFSDVWTKEEARSYYRETIRENSAEIASIAALPECVTTAEIVEALNA